MTTLICNRDAGGNYDTLTTEHAASSYGIPVLIHVGTGHGPADMYDEGLFGARPTREVEIKTTGMLTGEQLTMLDKWQRACA